MRCPAYQFLYACLRNDGNAARASVSESLQDWEPVVQAAMEDRLLPLLHSLIGELELSPLVPTNVLDFLSAVEDLNRERNTHILNEVKFAARLLNEVGIEPVLLKGLAYLTMGVYSNPGARYLADIDVLLPESQLQAAAELLVRHGFEIDGSDQFGYFRHHHPPMRRPGSAFIEIHHSLCVGKCGSLLPGREVIARSAPFDLDGVKVRVPCPEDLLTHLVLHSQILHPYNERIWPPLRAMYDLNVVLRCFGHVMDWNRIERRFRKAGKFGLLALHLLQVNESLGVEVPFQAKKSVLMRIRWLRRKLLRRIPGLRYFDPVYMFSTVLVRRLRVFWNMLGKPNGFTHLIRQLLTTGVYRRFAADVAEGRGR
jgi:hypothetical protein